MYTKSEYIKPGVEIQTQRDERKDTMLPMALYFERQKI